MTNIAKLQELLAAATPGPWQLGRWWGQLADGQRIFGTETMDGPPDKGPANAALIVEAVNALPQLLALASPGRAGDDEVRAGLVIIESPYAGEVAANVAYARAAMRDSLDRGEHPLASHLLYTQPGILDDENPEERAREIAAGLAWRKAGAKAVFYVDRGWSSGMVAARETYIAEGVPFEERTVPAALLERQAAGEGVLREALRRAEFGLSEMIRLADMGLEESLKEPEERGNFAAYTRAVECLATVRATLAAQPPAGPNMREAKSILEDALSMFRCTQKPERYPDDHWSNRAISFLQAAAPVSTDEALQNTDRELWREDAVELVARALVIESLGPSDEGDEELIATLLPGKMRAARAAVSAMPQDIAQGDAP